MREIFDHKVWNEYTLDEIGKKKLWADGNIPITITCEESICNDSMDFLNLLNESND